MRICPTCRTAYPARGRATCERDGARLLDAEEYAASRRDPLLGKNVTGRFAVRERIGVGGMGTVYRADQAGLDRPVALKVLKKELITDDETVARFHREAKAMSLLMHPNTVRVFDFGEDDGHLFLAMELLEGELLTAWIEREGTPPIEQAIETTQQILRSLSEAHSKGLVHRDLKPDNIMLARVEGQARPVVKVLDFGIAKVFREDDKLDQLETQAGTVFGTPRYMSPEQAQGKDLDHRSDLYSVGVLIYQMLTGHAPFLDDDAVVVMAKHIREEPVPVRRAAPDRPIPRSLERVVARALEKQPEDRFGSADEFESALAAALPDVAEEAERFANGRPSAMMTAFRELPRVPLIIGAAVVTLALGASIALVVGSGPSDATATDRVSGGPPVATAAVPSLPTQAPVPARSIIVRSTPPLAEVRVNGSLVGNAPCDVDVSSGPVSATVQLAGYLARQVEIGPGSAPIVDVALEREPAPTVEPVTPRRRGVRRSSAGNESAGEASGASSSPPAGTSPDEPHYEVWDP
ncbi:MAG: protein kinase [Sandaracinaceae bacterium]